MKEVNLLMSGPEIQAKIIANLKIIEEEAKNGLFTLSKRAQAAVEENKHLRNICPHEYDELGFCIYCDKEVE